MKKLHLIVFSNNYGHVSSFIKTGVLPVIQGYVPSDQNSDRSIVGTQFVQSSGHLYEEFVGS